MRPASTSPDTSSLSHIRTVAVIPARYASTRLPGKPLADIGGRTMVEHVYRRVEAAPSVGAVFVATDDERILDAVTAFGGEARMTRPNHHSGTDRLAEIIDTVSCDLVVNVQADEPLIEPHMIDAVVAACGHNREILMSTLRCPIRHTEDLQNSNVVKVAVDRKGFALFFSRGAIGFDRRTEHDFAAPAVYKHIGMYAYRRSFLLTLTRLEQTPLERAEDLEQLRALEHGHRIMTTETQHDPIGVDTPEELERVRRLLLTGASV